MFRQQIHFGKLFAEPTRQQVMPGHADESLEELEVINNNDFCNKQK